MVVFWDVAIQRNFLTNTWKQQVGKFWPAFHQNQMDICILVTPRYVICFTLRSLHWLNISFFQWFIIFYLKLFVRQCLSILGWQKIEMEAAIWGVYYLLFPLNIFLVPPVYLLPKERGCSWGHEIFSDCLWLCLTSWTYQI